MTCADGSVSVPEMPLVSDDRLRSRRRMIILCGGILLVLILWLIVWPYTGEDDSVLHYLTARQAASNPAMALGAWARPLHKLLLAGPASVGIIPARILQALLTIALVWQTMRLAEDLRISRAWLAGVMLICQPLVFALASDTMTELPLALGATVALRLWHARRMEWFCFVAGLLPLVRPEGFFIAPAAAAVMLFGSTNAPIPRRVLSASLATVGVIAWMAACAILVHNWHYFIDVWSWPAHSYASYGHGSLLYHIARWPWYCGWILFPLFCAGLYRSMTDRAMRLPLAYWATILLLHSILFWRGWFASIGEMRILTTTSPVTALICLNGWNALAGRIRRPRLRMALGATAITLAVATAMIEYTRHVKHYRCFGVRDVARFLAASNLPHDGVPFFTGDKMILAEFGDADRAVPILMDRQQMLKQLDALPAGAIGMWDNQLAQNWCGISIDDLSNRGFRILHEYNRTVWDGPEALLSTGWMVRLRYVVLQKQSQSP